MQDTSLEAYERIQPKLGEIQKVVYDRMRMLARPVTHHELISLFREAYSPSTIRTRVSELVKLGLVVPAGTTLINTGLQDSRVNLWRAV